MLSVSWKKESFSVAIRGLIAKIIRRKRETRKITFWCFCMSCSCIRGTKNLHEWHVARAFIPLWLVLMFPSVIDDETIERENNDLRLATLSCVVSSRLDTESVILWWWKDGKPMKRDCQSSLISWRNYLIIKAEFPARIHFLGQHKPQIMTWMANKVRLQSMYSCSVIINLNLWFLPSACAQNECSTQTSPGVEHKHELILKLFTHLNCRMRFSSVFLIGFKCDFILCTLLSELKGHFPVHAFLNPLK